MKPCSDPGGTWELGTLALFLQGRNTEVRGVNSVLQGPRQSCPWQELHMTTDQTVLTTVLGRCISCSLPLPLKVSSLHLHLLPSSTFREEAGHYLFGLSPLLPRASPQFLFVLKFLMKKEPPHLAGCSSEMGLVLLPFLTTTYSHSAPWIE